jgi:hypothetical protein
MATRQQWLDPCSSSPLSICTPVARNQKIFIYHGHKLKGKIFLYKFNFQYLFICYLLIYFLQLFKAYATVTYIDAGISFMWCCYKLNENCIVETKFKIQGQITQKLACDPAPNPPNNFSLTLFLFSHSKIMHFENFNIFNYTFYIIPTCLLYVNSIHQ